MNRKRTKDKHLPRCVYFKHGAYWYVKGGKWKNLGKDLSEALAQYARIVSEPTGAMSKLIDTVLDAHAPKVSASTLAQYKIAAKSLKHTFAEFSPEQVKPKHIAAIKLAGMKSPNMTNRKISFLRVVFQYALEWQQVESNPCVGIKRHAEKKRDRYLTDDEFFAIRDKAVPRLQVILDLLYCTGQRINDVLKIGRGDITEKGIVFRQQKTGAKLTVLWTPEMKAAVERAKALYGNAPGITLLRGRGGKPPDYRTVLYQWHQAREKAGVEDATPHDMRAKSGTDTRRQGNDAQALLGHTSPAMTERYIRLREAPEVSGPIIRRK